MAMSQRVIPFEERPLMCPACDCFFSDHVMGELVELLLIESILSTLQILL